MRCGRPENDHHAGRFETERQALDTPAVRAVYTAFEAAPGLGRMQPPNLAMLRAVREGPTSNDAEEDVTERVSLTHQQSTAGHPLSYVAIVFNGRRMLAGAAPGGGLPVRTPGLLPHACTTAPGLAAPTFRPGSGSGSGSGTAHLRSPGR